MFEHTDIDLADQCRNILVILVTGLGLGDCYLVENRGLDFDHLELRDITAEFIQTLDRPGRHDLVQIAFGDAKILLKNFRILVDVKQSQRRFENRRILDRVDRYFLHQYLQPIGQRRLASTHGAQQVEDLFFFLQALRRMLEVGHDLLDRILHTVKFRKSGVAGN